MKYLKKHLEDHIKIASEIDLKSINEILKLLINLKKRKGRLFILGVGGSAGNASHAVNDFRKLCGIEAYGPADNVSELTARTNDDGWENVFSKWLETSNLTSKDMLLFFSVGGGSVKRNVSVNLIKASRFAKKRKSKIASVIGRKKGYLRKISDACCVVPDVNKKSITPHTETYQVFIWHMLVSHPKLQIKKTVW
jgi:D-sedoheptulose 7-phosphate isomerase